MPIALPEFPAFDDFSFLCLDGNGRFLDLPKGARSLAAGRLVPPEELPEFLSRKIYLREGVTDVFVWVHGWRNKLDAAIATARRLFGNLDAAIQQSAERYPKAAPIVPAFVAVHWPSRSPPTLKGYCTIRDLAAKMTTDGDAEFFLASLLGYLDNKNKRTKAGRVLRARSGHYIHCLGHSFGCRFLTAAIRASADPQARTLSLVRTLSASKQRTLSVGSATRTLGPSKRRSAARSAKRTLSERSERLFEFTVDSVCFLQMAAPATGFSDELSLLVDESPLRGPLALTHTKFDRGTCFWHQGAEGETGIGCQGALQPAQWIGNIVLRPPTQPYPPADFKTLLVNVDANAVYCHTGLRPEGAHSDFWYEETIHLILSLVDYSRR
jgi:hypothetical protein